MNTINTMNTITTITTTPAAAEACNADCQPAVSPIANRPDLTDRIARLPKATRDMLNVMLDDGLPYHVILDELGETARGLSAGSLAKWVKAGYADYLKEQQTIEDVKSEAEFAADFLRELGNIDPSVIHRACHIVVSLQMFRAIRKFGDEALGDMLRANPSSYFSLLNTLCNMVQPTIDLENHRLALAKAGATPPTAQGKM